MDGGQGEQLWALTRDAEQSRKNPCERRVSAFREYIHSGRAAGYTALSCSLAAGWATAPGALWVLTEDMDVGEQTQRSEGG